MAHTAHEFVTSQGREPAEYSWPGSETQLALATLTVALHESRLRRDVQFGEGPLGRGQLGESCLLQLHLEQAPRFAPWLSAEEKAALSRSAALRERFAQSLLGDEPSALQRCFSIGMRMLVRARSACGATGAAWARGMFSMYGSGARCRVSGLDNRARTFEALEALALRGSNRRVEEKWKAGERGN